MLYISIWSGVQRGNNFTSSSIHFRNSLLRISGCALLNYFNFVLERKLLKDKFPGSHLFFSLSISEQSFHTGFHCWLWRTSNQSVCLSFVHNLSLVDFNHDSLFIQGLFLIAVMYLAVPLCLFILFEIHILVDLRIHRTFWNILSTITSKVKFLYSFYKFLCASNIPSRHILPFLSSSLFL